MKKLWTSNLLLLITCIALTPVFSIAQEEEAGAKDDTPNQAIFKIFEEEDFLKMMGALRGFRPKDVLADVDGTRLPADVKNLLRGWAYHQLGDYGKVNPEFDKVNAENPIFQGFFGNRMSELGKTAEQLKDFKVLETANFSIRYQEGRDQVMIHFLPDILEKAYAELAGVFQFARDEKIIVELMPDHDLFSYASSLTRQQIETTGTIALCVENRLVVLTPRRVLKGYHWPDTIAHELVHYMLTRMSDDQAPLWLQEGVAKYFETYWTGTPGPPLDRTLESSLANALETGEFITIEQMYPSFAALPTAALAMLAYAQTTSLVDYLCEQKGRDFIRQLAVSLKDQPVEKLLEAHFNQDLDKLIDSWKVWAGNKGYQKHDVVDPHGVTLLDDDVSSEALAGLEEGEETIKKHHRLGDLLLERRRFGAALKEYRKSYPGGDRLPRQIVLRVLKCLEGLRQFPEIPKLIKENVTALNQDQTMLVYKAFADLNMGKLAETKQGLEQAIHLNPFNPRIYELLMEVYQREGNEAELQRSTEILDLLRQQVKSSAPTKEDKS